MRSVVLLALGLEAEAAISCNKNLSIAPCIYTSIIL